MRADSFVSPNIETQRIFVGYFNFTIIESVSLKARAQMGQDLLGASRSVSRLSN